MYKASEKKFYPVIHCVDPYTEGGIGHALVNASTAKANGADGVFLIGHNHLSFTDLSYIYEHTRKHFPDLWIGINFLDISVNDPLLVQAVNRCAGLNALWTDGLPNVKLKLPESIQIFGGVAFKYMNPNPTDDDLTLSCRRASKFVDVATTSGDRTGFPPEITKLEKIRGRLDDNTKLAIASGITEGNVTSFFPTTDIFLVASSISKADKDRGGHDYLIPEKVNSLAKMIHRNIF